MKSTEEIILSCSQRGMDILASTLPADFCTQAAKSLFYTPKGNILVCTGFCCHGKGETDIILFLSFL